jgi:NADH-quinone oxidoreductase subunit L
VGAVVAGWVGIAPGMTFHRVDLNWLHHFLEPVIARLPGGEEHGHLPLGVEWELILISVGVAVLGIWLARRWWGRRGVEADLAFARRLPAVHRTLENKYWVDELYDKTVVRGTWAAAHGLQRFDAGVIDGFLVNGLGGRLTVFFAMLSGLFDKYFVDGLVNLSGRLMTAGSRYFRRAQTGFVSQYALVLVFGVFALVCAFIVLRGR